jgi:nucleotide-binding universal stress UspA family protein
MKNILVPVDFSDASFNAISYAAFLSNALDTPLTLVHAYTDTSAYDEGPENHVYDSMEELEAANEKFLKKEMEEFSKKFTVSINCIVKKGNPVKVINEVAQETKPQLIIMGMKGKGESNSIFGSTTTSIIGKTMLPLLVVPFKASYQTIDTITLASDFNDEKLLSNFTILEQFISHFNPFIQILNVQTRPSSLTAKEIADKMKIGLQWDQYNYSFNIIKKDDIEEGINKFLKHHPTDLLVMVAKEHSFIEQILGVSHTKKMTQQTEIPLLVLHE